MPLLFEAIAFLDDIEMEKKCETLPDGTPRETKYIKTPEGMLTEIKEFPKDKGEYHREFLVKGEQDVPAFVYLIRKTTEAIVKNPAIRKKVDKDISVIKNEVGGQFPLLLWPFIPAMELICSLYMDQMTAVYLIYDHMGYKYM